jgi:hypothetical protein
MPYEIRPLGKRGHYEVINAETGEVHAKDTTLKKAKAQMRLLNRLGGLEGGKAPKDSFGPPTPPEGAEINVRDIPVAAITLAAVTRLYQNVRRAYLNGRGARMTELLEEFVERYDLDEDNIDALPDDIRAVFEATLFLNNNTDDLYEVDYEPPVDYLELIPSAMEALEGQPIDFEDPEVRDFVDRFDPDDYEGAGFHQALQPVNYTNFLKSNFF